MRHALIGLLCAGMTLPGCKEDRWNPGGGGDDSLDFPRGRLYTLGVEEVQVDKAVGGDEAKAALKAFLDKNSIFLFTSPDQKHIYTLGFTAPAASYGRSHYERVRGRSDHLYVHLPAFGLSLVKDDGTTFELDISDVRIDPAGQADGGIIGDEFRARVRGGFAIQKPDARYSGAFHGSWYARRDTAPPEVTIVPPGRGLVSGAFDVYFDEPVSVGEVTSRIFLRDDKNEPVKIRVRAQETDIDDYTARVAVDTLDLLPFGKRLTLAVGTAFADLAGNRLARPEVKVVSTPSPPPMMHSSGHDFSTLRKDEEFLLQGDAELVESWRGMEPATGRLLKLVPPPSGARYSSALVSRMVVPHDAVYIQVRVLKAAEARDPDTPCLKYTMAQPSGLLWNVECAPADAPRLPGEDAKGEFFLTPWQHMNISVEGQRGQEVILVLEAPPLEPDASPGTNPVFLIEGIRAVWEGQDPKMWETDDSEFWDAALKAQEEKEAAEEVARKAAEGAAEQASPAPAPK